MDAINQLDELNRLTDEMYDQLNNYATLSTAPNDSYQ
uniref:Flagellar export chaperone FliS n=1 Tax=Heterorhabditis bacteriophora TaxID=37862 RepID=A0A1I7WMB3_HETBA